MKTSAKNFGLVVWP